MDIATQLSSYFDDIVDIFVDSTISDVINIGIPLVTIALTMSFMLRGAVMMVSPGGDSFSDLIKRFLGVAMIISFAGAGGFYQNHLAGMAMSLPDELSVIITSNIGMEGTTLVEAIDSSILVSSEVITEALANAGIRAAGLASLLFGFLFLLSTIVICGMALAYLVVSKILLAITVAFGPAFIFLLLFNPTKGMFSKWLGSVINYSLLLVLLAAVISIVMGLFERTLMQVSDGNASFIEGILASGLIVLASVVATVKLPGLSSSWGGGISSSLLGFLPASMAARTGGAAGGAAGGGGGGNTTNNTPGSGSSDGSAKSGSGGGQRLRYARK